MSQLNNLSQDVFGFKAKWPNLVSYYVENKMKKKSIVIPLCLLNLVACGGDSNSESIPDPIPPETVVPPVTGTVTCEDVNCESANKFLVTQIYDDIINGENIGIVDTLFEEAQQQENTTFFSTLIANNPNYVATIKHIVGDGDYVAVHWHYSDTPDDEFTGMSRVDLYKLDNDEITERTSLSTQFTSDTASGNSLFSDLYDYGSTLPNNDVNIEEENKTFISEFYVNAFNNDDLALIDAQVDIDYIQHNPFVPNGRSGLSDFVRSDSSPSNVAILITLAEGDLVWTFRSDAAVFDLWRVDNNINQIVEHWDIF